MNGEVLAYADRDRDEEQVRREAKQNVKNSVRQLTQAWRDMLSSAWDHKQDKFGDDAEEAMGFFNEDHSFIWEAMGERVGDPKVKESNPGFEMTYNVVAELVQIFGPYIYHRNPNRIVDPIRPLEFPQEAIVDPTLAFEASVLNNKLQQIIEQASAPLMEQATANGVEPQMAQQAVMQAVMQYPEVQALQQQIAEINGQLIKQQEMFGRLKASQAKGMARKTAKSLIMQRVLNYTPRELNLREHSRKVVDEAIIKGEGVWWTEIKEFDDDDRILVGSFYDSINNLLIDPDVADFDDAMWIARKKCAPTWMLEQKWGRKPGSIKGTTVSNSKKKRVYEDQGVWSQPQEQPTGYKATNDITVYYEIYSKMGIGTRLEGVPEEIRDKLEQFGDFCYLVICEGCDEPLNLTVDSMYEKDPEELFMDVQWPIPFHKDNTWPCTPLVFHWVPNSAWGMSHIKPGIGELKFLDFAMSHLARKIKSASVDIIGVLASAADDIRKQLEDPDDGSGYKIVEIASHYGKSVADLFSVMQRPPFHGDIWNVVAAVAERLDRRLGLTEMNRSGGTARSALDSKNRQESFAIRPQDMAKRVEEQASLLSRKEALAVAWFMQGKDVAPIVGEEAAFLYDELIYNQDPISIVREYDFQVEADSIRRPSKETDQENMTMVTQSVFPTLVTYSMQTNDYEPVNEFLSDLKEAYNLKRTYVLRGAQAQPVSPEQQQIMEMQRQMAELNLQAQLQQAKNIEAQMRLAEAQIVAKLQGTDLDLGRKQALAQIDIDSAIRAMEQRVADSMLERKLDAAEHAQEMEQDRQAFEVTLKANQKGGGDAKMMTNYRRDYRGYR